MSTRSTINVKLPDGRFKNIYCHFDGYLSNNGMLLHKNIKTQEQAEALLEKGDMSSLNFENGQNISEYYRDRGEEDVDYKLLFDDELQEHFQEFDYMWDGKQWNLWREGEGWISLLDALFEDEECRPLLEKERIISKNHCPHCGKRIV